jgi:hypothetical protein
MMSSRLDALSALLSGAKAPPGARMHDAPTQPVMLPNFQGERQAQQQWCWAAAAASIYNYYGATVNPIRSAQPQCVFVSDQEGVDGCTLNPRPGTCIKTQCFNRATSIPEHLNIELAKYDLLEFSVTCDGTDQRLGDHVFHGGFDGDEIRTYIDSGRPIALRVLLAIVDDRPISHFVIITGYYPVAADRIVIWDPYVGEQHLTQEEFRSLYGPLEQKYLTKYPSPLAKFTVVDPDTRSAPQPAAGVTW